MTTVGYILSPLSWWNDLYVNIPIAYGLAWLCGFITDRRYFGIFMVFFYWLTNLAGFMLMHKGLTVALQHQENAEKSSILKDLWVSIVYTGILALLVYSGILKYPTDYFK